MSSGAGEGGEGVSDDSLESSLSAFQTMPNDFRSALDDFRNNWQRELQQKQQPKPNTNEETAEQQPPLTADELQETADVIAPLVNDEQAEQQALAKNLFHKAVELEQSGKVYDAIPFYRKAVQIEPNIEFKYYEHQKLKSNVQNPIKVVLNTTSPPESNEGLLEEDLPDDLYEKFQLDLSHNQHGQLIQSSRDSGIITTEMHISELPPELLIYILRWVVSNQLDMRSLEQCAAVCKGMYILARDEELWKSACVKVWGHNVGTLTHTSGEDEKSSIGDGLCPVIPRYSTWRQMFIERERVLFNGCYISKTTYLRMGENSFQDQYYRPVQLVEYYRYIRFLPDGTVLMMTSSDEPSQGVTKLKNLHQLRPDILKGQYRLFGSTLSIVVSKQQGKFITNPTTTAGGYTRHNRRGSMAYDEGTFNSTKYCIEFRILNKSKRKFAQLMWLHYSVIQIRNKHETTSEFELTPSKYPPLWFSPVRSYHLDADAPLA
ncbi:F-box only protein 9 [Lucilia cuprina]|uniref:F-box only protein 9 n=1 Tax=Lucilia cuprina TaxID=7375 RepID=UPI001F06F586|nr:F-box only protein 9 [Lucilia cuprina]